MPIKDPSIAERFASDVEKHQLQIVRDDDMHRHIKLGRPETGIMRFDLITWPGSLCYTGDMGTFVFSRTKDMFNFFRKKTPNPYYWSEKVLAADRYEGISRYSADAFKAKIKEEFENHTCDWEEGKKKVIWLRVEELVLSVADGGEYLAREAASQFSVFRDFWEVDCKEYSFHFEWCCHAIPWAIAQYDKHKELQLTRS